MFYLLKDRTAIPCNAQEFGGWMKENDRTLWFDRIDLISISTIFLGVDHSADVDPLVFETLVFNERELLSAWKYSTWAHAEAGHNDALAYYTTR